MVFNALQINSYVFSEECKWKKICSVDERWHLRSANSASITTPSHWPSSGRLGAGMQRLASAGPQLQHERGGAYWQTKALQTSRLSPNSHLFPNRATTAKRRPAVLSTVRKVWMVRSTGAGARKLFERIVPTKRHAETDTIDHAGRWLDQRVAILADQPLCSDELDDQLSIQVFFAGWSASSSFSRSLHATTARWDRARAGSARCSARGDRRARPAQLLRFFKFSDCACVKISPSVWPILGDVCETRRQLLFGQPKR